MNLIKTPFTIELISDLIKEEAIAEAIKLPLLLGAYKMKLGAEEVDIAFLNQVYNDIVESLATSNTTLYFRKCTSSNDFAFEICSAKPQDANAAIVNNGKNVIFIKDEKLLNDLDCNSIEAKIYFLNKLIEISTKYCNYIDGLEEPKYSFMRELDIKKYFAEGVNYPNKELEVIVSILDK